jgi:uncharacterized protein (TIGR04255 family)
MTKSKPLPKKLGKEPLIEAIFEIRFQGASLASNLLLGYLMSKLGNNLPVKKSPALDIPEQLRSQNLAFKYSPLFQVSWGKYSILIGDWMCAITNSVPYQGWRDFKKAIMEIVQHLQACGFIKKIERYSLKYVDLIEASTTEQQLALIKLDMKLGDYDVKDNPLNLRVELSKNSFLHVVEIISNTILADESKPKNGILVNIDSIANNPLEDFWESLSDNLELIHKANKELFFNFLKEETLISLEPSYDN